MRLHEDHSLSEVAQQTLRGVFVREPSPAIAEQTLARFVLGATSRSEEHEIIAALVRSVELRSLTVRLQTEIGRLDSLPLADARATFEPGLVSVIDECLNSALDCYSNLQSWCLAAGWEEIKTSWLGRSVLAANSLSCRRQYDSPRYALVRGSHDRFGFADFLLEGVTVRCIAELDPRGTLCLAALFGGENPVEAASLDGRRLCCEWVDPSGGSIPMGQAAISGSQWTLELPGFAGICAPAPDSVLPSQFLLSEAGAPPTPAGRNQLFVELEDGSAVSLEFHEAPRIEAGRLIFGLSANAAIREPFASHRLDLLLSLGTASVLLGSWPVSEWKQDRKTFEARVPSTAVGALGCASLLQARFVAPA